MGLYNFDEWVEINAELAVQWGLAGDQGQVMVFKGLHHALIEICSGLVQQFPHKTSAHYVEPLDPVFYQTKLFLQKNGFDLEGIRSTVFEDFSSILEGLSTRHLFTILFEDDPMLGALRNISAFKFELLEKRIFTIEVSHNSFSYRPIPKQLSSYEIRILSLTPNLAVALLGKRVRVPADFSQALVWRPGVVNRVMDLTKTKALHSDRVLEFEKNCPADSKSVFRHGENRIADRACLYWTDMDGQAVCHYLAQEIGHSLKSKGWEQKLMTTSLTEWNQKKWFNWMDQYTELTPEARRGLVVIHQDLINKTLADSLVKVRTKILKMQNG